MVVPPVAEAPPAVPVVPPLGSVVLLLPQAKTQEATPNTRTSDPTLFFIMKSLTETEGSRARRSSQEAFSPPDLDGAERLQTHGLVMSKGHPPDKTGHRRSQKKDEGRRLERETESHGGKGPPTPGCPQDASSVGPVHEVPRGQEVKVHAKAYGHNHGAKSLARAWTRQEPGDWSPMRPAVHRFRWVQHASRPPRPPAQTMLRDVE